MFVNSFFKNFVLFILTSKDSCCRIVLLEGGQDIISFASRLKERRESLGLSRSSLAQQIGVTTSAIGNYENGVSSPKEEILYKLFNALKVEPNYLWQDEMSQTDIQFLVSYPERAFLKKYRALDEHGKELVDSVLDLEHKRVVAPAKANAPKVLQLPKGKRSRDGMTEIDVYDEPSAAGLGNYVSEAVPSHMEQYSSEYVPTKTSFGVLISGNSMEPKIPNGSTVFVQAAPALDSGEIGIFVLDGQAYCKKLVIDHDNHRTVLRSINPDYSDIEVEAWREFRTLGRVLGWYTPPVFD